VENGIPNKKTSNSTALFYKTKSKKNVRTGTLANFWRRSSPGLRRMDHAGTLKTTNHVIHVGDDDLHADSADECVAELELAERGHLQLFRRRWDVFGLFSRFSVAGYIIQHNAFHIVERLQSNRRDSFRETEAFDYKEER
jgi:hypothetical protein